MPLREVCLSEIDLIIDAGYTKPLPLVTINNNKVGLMRTIMLHYALLRSKSAIDQLAEGLSALGIIEAMKLHPELFEPLFVRGKQVPLTSGKNEHNSLIIFVTLLRFML